MTFREVAEAATALQVEINTAGRINNKYNSTKYFALYRFGSIVIGFTLLEKTTIMKLNTFCSKIDKCSSSFYSNTFFTVYEV